jgi:endonuclease-3
VILGTAFGIASGVVVDTHVGRISRRLGWTRETDPVKVERDLERLIPKSDWIRISHLLIDHGRKTCQARKPDCDHCPVAGLCKRLGVAKSAA